MYNLLKRRSLLKMIPALAVLPKVNLNQKREGVLILSTWNNRAANEVAKEVLLADGDVVSAVVKGINVAENDPKDMSVGYGGRPDRDGNVTLDACIMNEVGMAGGVAAVEGYRNPIDLARIVMDKTPHVLMVGQHVSKLAEEHGFVSENLLTKEAEEQWQEWQKTSKYKPVPNIEMHDTIGLLAYNNGVFAGGCSTSGVAYKMAGRVGDSPIIGAGLYSDPAVGACVCTGLGEIVLRNLSSFLVVEFMRQGMSPENACKAALKRITEKQKIDTHSQVGLIAVDKDGNYGGYALLPGFIYALTDQNGTLVLPTKSIF